MLRSLLSAITAPPAGGLAEAQRHLDSLTKPPGSLGRLEELAARLAVLAGGAPRVERPHIFTFAADHGVVAEGVSAYPQIVTAQMVENFLRGGAAVNVLARQAEARVVVADFGVANPIPGSPGLHSCPIAPGTANLARGPAMTRAQALQALETGARLAEQALDAGADLLATGEMGIGNTTAASAIAAAITGAGPERVTGRGTGVDDATLARKVDVVRRALAVNVPDARDGLDVLAKVGGFEIAELVGGILAGAAPRVPLGLDGPLRGLPRERGCAGEAGARTAVLTTRALVIAGLATGLGKTSITLGLLEALRRRDLRIQAFKVGPDFIDPGFHALATGRPSYNLDGWMCGYRAVQACVARQSQDAHLAVAEGVMGCFDGIDGTSEEGSTAQIAKWLGASVVLVVDAWASARSAAAVVRGFESFDPALNLAGVIVNRVGGDAHGRMVLDAIAATCRATPLGAVARDETLTLPERHLGLVTAAEGVLDAGKLRRLAGAVERSVDLDRLLSLATPLAIGSGGRRLPGECSTEQREAAPSRPVRIGVASDAAFQFYYAENFDLLREAGAERGVWSALRHSELPDVDGLYFGGGYPELHPRRLAENAAMRKAVRRFAEAGRPGYAQCGGPLYLAGTVGGADGVAPPMVGVLPPALRLGPRRMALRHPGSVLTRDTPIGPARAVARGHEFHYSTLDPVPAGIERVYRVAQRGAPARAEGYLVGRTLMSYIHLHFASNPELPRAFVAACAGSRA